VQINIAGVKRIYGDWTSAKHAQWKLSLLEYSITPIQQFAYTTGKNATDSSMIIDAMDLMYGQRLDGFCLVSSDSDFTRLAQRLREAGMVVYGFGERKTPKPFVVACDKFIYTEVLRKDGAMPSETLPVAQLSSRLPQAAPATPAVHGELCFEQAATSNSPKPLEFVGSYLTKVQPDFDPRLYGSRKLSELLRRHPDQFETSERGMPGSPSKAVYARVMAQKAPRKDAV